MRRFRIITPEQVSFHYHVAGLMSRFVAWVADAMLIYAGYLAVVITFSRLGGQVGTALIILGIFAIDFSYHVLFELYRAGQSPGKRLMNIRVISQRGTKLTFVDVLVRNVMRWLDSLPFAMVVGGISAAIDPLHRRLGDVVAETIVVRDTRKSLPAALSSEKGRVNSFSADPALRNRILTQVNRDERDLVLDLVLRRDQIEPHVREELFGRAASHFRQKLSLPPDLDHLSDEQAVVNLALVIQDAKFTL